MFEMGTVQSNEAPSASTTAVLPPVQPPQVQNEQQMRLAKRKRQKRRRREANARVDQSGRDPTRPNETAQLDGPTQRWEARRLQIEASRGKPEGPQTGEQYFVALQKNSRIWMHETAHEAESKGRENLKRCSVGCCSDKDTDSTFTSEQMQALAKRSAPRQKTSRNSNQAPPVTAATPAASSTSAQAKVYDDGYPGLPERLQKVPDDLQEALRKIWLDESAERNLHKVDSRRHRASSPPPSLPRDVYTHIVPAGNSRKMYRNDRNTCPRRVRERLVCSCRGFRSYDDREGRQI